MPRVKGRPGESMPPFDFDKLNADLSARFEDVNEKDVMSAALYPQVTEDYLGFREKYGPVDKLDTRIFLVGPKVGEEFEVTIEKGKTLAIKALALAADLTPNGEREVFFELNGQLRSVFIRDSEASKVSVFDSMCLNKIRAIAIVLSRILGNAHSSESDEIDARSGRRTDAGNGDGSEGKSWRRG